MLTAQKFTGTESSKEDTEETWLHSLQVFQLEKLEQDIALLGSDELSLEDYARLQALKEECSASLKRFSDTLEKEDSYD